jgi:hypothetical protein
VILPDKTLIDPQRAKLMFRVGIGLFIAVVLFVIWQMIRPNPLVTSAREMTQAMQSGDGDALFGFASSMERNCSNLDQDKLQKAWRVLIGPRIANSKFLRADPIEASSNGWQATSSVWFENKSDGKSWQLAMISNKSDEGFKTGVLIMMVICSDPPSAFPVGESRTLSRIRKHRASLEALGIEKVMLNPGNCVSWDQLEAMLAGNAK